MGSSGDIIFWLAMANPKPDGLVGYGSLMMNLAGAHVKRVGRQRKWDTRGGRKTREIWGGVSSLDEVEYFR